MYQVTIPASKVNSDDLHELVQRLVGLTGKRATIETCFIVSTEDMNVSMMLDALADTLKTDQPLQVPVKKERKVRAQKSQKKNDGEKKEPTRGPAVRSIQFIGSDERISRIELDKRLREHTIEPGTRLHHPSLGKLIVRNGGGEGEPLTVVNEDGVPVR